MICLVSFAEIMPFSGKIQEIPPKSNQLVVKLLEIPYHPLHLVSDAHINCIRDTEDDDKNQII